MDFYYADNIFTIHTDITATVTIAAIVLLIGMQISKKVKFINKYCIPAAVVGGFITMIIIFLGSINKVFNVEFDTTLQNIFMVAFFSTIGLSADFKILKKGGKLLLVYWLLTAIIAGLQGPIALFLGHFLGMENAYSITAGAITMCGGHGAGAAYGSTIASRGYTSATDCALAAATFGLICSVLIGGPIARSLIKRNHLELPKFKAQNPNIKHQKPITADDVKNDTIDIFINFTAILICMTLGVFISSTVSKLLTIAFNGSQITLPDYIGAMFISAIVRNFNEKFKWFHYDKKFFDKFGQITLDIFLSIAMMSIKLHLLLGLVGGLLIIVCVQVIFMAIYVYVVVFNVLGKNYDAAVMCAGLCGHGLGATPTAMANMEAVTNQYGFSKTAFIIVPIVGAFMSDLVWQPLNIMLINIFVPVV